MSNELVERATESGLIKSAGPALVEGMEGIDDKELKVGSVVLVQKGLDVFIDKGIPVGSLVNSATEAKMDNTEFIPVYMAKKWFLYDNTGIMPKFVAAASNENDPIFNGKLRLEDITKEMYAKKIKAEVIPVIFVVSLNDGQPIKIAFKRASSYYAGQDLYTLARKAKTALWTNKYRLGSKLIPAGKAPAYWAMTVELVGPTTPEEQAYAKQLNSAFQAKPDVTEEVPF